MQPTFKVLEGPDAGKTFPVIALITTLGRDPTCEFRLTDAMVSRQHAEISYSHGICEITDLNSSNGLWREGERITRHLLKHGDRVSLGRTLLQFGAHQDKEAGARLSTQESQTITADQAALARWPDDVDVNALRRAKADLETLYRFGRAINPLLEVGQLVPRILKLILDEIKKVDRCSVVLVDPATGHATFRASSGRHLRTGAQDTYSTTIVQQVVQEKRALLVYDAMADDKLRSAESVARQNIRSAVCAPLQSQNAVLGVIYCDTIDPEHRFTRDDFRLIAALGLEAGVALANTQMFDRLVHDKIELQEAHQRLKATQHHLVQSEKMAAVGRLAAGIVHDLKNPMTVILGYTDLALDKLARAQPGQVRDLKIDEDLATVQKGVGFCNEVITNLLKFARPSKLEKSATDLNGLVRDTVRFLQTEFNKAGVRVGLNLDAHLPALHADASQLRQVLVNILLNAVQAMDKPEKRIEVSTGLSSAAKKPQVYLAIADNGKGMGEMERSRVFDPFFTTKDISAGAGGSGLGLSMSYTIVQSHGGVIGVESKPGEGSTFRIDLPLQGPS